MDGGDGGLFMRVDRGRRMEQGNKRGKLGESGAIGAQARVCVRMALFFAFLCCSSPTLPRTETVKVVLLSLPDKTRARAIHVAVPQELK